MLLNNGTQERLISETAVAGGSTVKEGSIKSDSLLVSLWVNSITTGTLSLKVYTLTDTGKGVEIIDFPAISTGTTNLLLKKSAVSLQRFRVVATYTGGCSYEVYVRAIEGGGGSESQQSQTLEDIKTELESLNISNSAIADSVESPLLTAGTEDGEVTSPKVVHVNNVRLQILATHDREQEIEYADFGTKNQRVTKIDYTSPTFPGIVARKEFVYTLVGNRYRRDSILWRLI